MPVQICRTGDVRQAAASLTATSAATTGRSAAEAGPHSPLHLSTSVKGLCSARPVLLQTDMQRTGTGLAINS